MASRLFAFTFDARNPQHLDRFWARFLGRETVEEPDGGVTLLANGWGGCGDPGDGAGFNLRFLPSQEPKQVPNQMHFDLTSDSRQDQQDKVARALELGARHLDIGQGPDATHVVLADPEGNEVDVITAGNNFLAPCGFIGTLAGDGSQETGYFWSRALGWPLVWDQDEETAIRSPPDGPKTTWGGPPLKPKQGHEHVHLDLAPPVGGDQQAEVERLVALGATRAEVAAGGAMDADRVGGGGSRRPGWTRVLRAAGAQPNGSGGTFEARVNGALADVKGFDCGGGHFGARDEAGCPGIPSRTSICPLQAQVER